MKKLIAYIIIITTLFSVVACKKPEVKQEEIIPEGYKTEESTGGTAIEAANLLSLSVESDEAETLLTLSFVKGSDIAGVAQGDSHGVPRYSVSMLKSPYRLRIAFDSLQYRDYERSIKGGVEASDWLFGSFSTSKTNKDGEKTIHEIYLQLKSKAAYSIAQDISEIKISIKRIEPQPIADEFSYYVTANTYEDYRAGTDFGNVMFPTQCKNGEKLLISEPFSTQEQAEKAMATYVSIYKQFAPAMEVTALYEGELPIYNENPDLKLQSSIDILEEGDYAAEVSVLKDDGVFLCDGNSEGTALYCLRHITDTDVYYTMSSVNTEFQFEGIEKAGFTKDGKKLAVLEGTTGGSHLYAFDGITGELIVDLTEAGLGKRISSFVWNDAGTVLYCIGGTGSTQLSAYDFTVFDEQKRKTVLLDSGIDESSLEMNSGSLYYVSSDENGSAIYRVKPETGAKHVVTEGSVFAFSPNGKLSAVSTAGIVAGNKDSVFEIITKSGEKTVITDKFPVYTFKWSKNGKLLYYIEDTQSKDNTESDTAQTETPSISVNLRYPYTLYVYDVESKTSKLLCNLTNSTIFTSESVEGIVLPYYLDKNGLGSNVYATYEAVFAE